MNNILHQKLEVRKKYSEYIKKNYKNKIPIIFIKNKNCNFNLKKDKFIFPDYYWIIDIKRKILNNIENNKDICIFLSINNNVLKNDICIKEVYKKYKKEDDFLYINFQDVESYGFSLKI